jgi:Replication initiator protein A
MERDEEREGVEAEVLGPPERSRQGRDELNLAEFPLSAIAERVNADQKTLVFEDQTWDESRVAMVGRKLVITASDEYGLPTAHDDEVILGLINLSKLNNFGNRVVHFSRYELLKLLGWSDESKSYKRLETSLKRWLGVTLYYKNAWWDKERQSWVDENFHLLDNVTLYDRESRGAHAQGALPLSFFTWNDVVFRSFSNGNLKSLDFDLYKSLQSSISKRLYRFLDKRFYRRGHWEFNLKEFSWEHIGLSRNYDAANLKRKLLPAIDELVRVKFLAPMPPEQRFKKLKSGVWNVAFDRFGKSAVVSKKAASSENRGLIEALIARGVTASTASATVASTPANKITAQLEVFDWLMAQPESKRPKNPPGFLVESIKGEYRAPANFVSQVDQAKRQADAAERKRKAEEKARAEQQREEQKRVAKENAVQNFWHSHSDETRRRMEEEAMETATEQQLRVINKGGPLAKTLRKVILEAYAIKVMQMAA